MATIDPKSGKERILKIGVGASPLQITNLQSNGISKGRDTRDVTTKQSGNNWREIRPTYKNGEIKFEAIYTEEDTGLNTYGDIEAWWNSGTEIDWEYGSGASGDRKESGKGYILNLENDDSLDGNAMFSGSITITGEITVGTYA